MSDLALQLARRFQPRHVLIVLAAVLASFLALDFVDAQGFESMRFFDLNDSDVTNRIGFSALTIGALMLGAAALTFSAAAKADPGTRTAFWFKAGAVAFLVLGVEEMLGIHTWLDGEGVSWNVSYLPLLAAGTLTWFEMARRIDKCLALRGARWMRSYVSTDGRRSVCEFEAPDAESVREAFRTAGQPFDRAWVVNLWWREA